MSDYNPFSLADKRILITGASSGIGRACALECSKLGANVILVARRGDGLQRAKDLLAKGEHHIEIADLSVGEQLVGWCKDVSSRCGTIDGIVHAAGLSLTLPIRATTCEDVRSLMAINSDAAFFLSKGIRQRGVRAASCSIVFIGSVMSLVGQPGLVAYSASKGALVSMTKALALELAREQIRVNLLAPGHVHTAMAAQVEAAIPPEAMSEIIRNHPLGIGSPEDIAHAAAYLLSDAARWVTGSTLVVDGGYTSA